MGSKVIVMLCLFLSMVVLNSTQVSAETFNTVTASTEQIVDARTGGPRGPGSHGTGGGTIDGGDGYGVHGCGLRGCKKCCT